MFADTYAFDFDGQIFELGTQAMVGLVHTGGLGQRRFQLRLGLHQPRRELLLHILQLLRPDTALAALALLPPHCRLAVRLLHQSL